MDGHGSLNSIAPEPLTEFEPKLTQILAIDGGWLRIHFKAMVSKVIAGLQNRSRAEADK